MHSRLQTRVMKNFVIEKNKSLANAVYSFFWRYQEDAFDENNFTTVLVTSTTQQAIRPVVLKL